MTDENSSNERGQITRDAQANHASSSADQGARYGDENQRPPSPLISNLIELHRQRTDLHRAEKGLTLRIKAKCRRAVGGDKTQAEKLYQSMFNGKGHELALTTLSVSAPFIQSRNLIAEQRRECEKSLTKLAKELPVYPWVESIRGFGAGSLAGIIGEAGDLSRYSNPAKLWKRMGLAVIHGERQRKVKDGASAKEHGYSPERRSLVWNIGDTMIRGNVRKVKDGDEDTGERMALNHYGQIYLNRKDYERPRVESDGHAHNRAKRYMEKRLLRDLWVAWRDAEQ